MKMMVSLAMGSFNFMSITNFIATRGIVNILCIAMRGIDEYVDYKNILKFNILILGDKRIQALKDICYVDFAIGQSMSF